MDVYGCLWYANNESNNELVTGANLNQPTNITGGPHIVVYCSDATKYWAQADLQVCDGSIPEIPC